MTVDNPRVIHRTLGARSLLARRRAHAPGMTFPDQPKLTVRSPADLITAVPYLLGFHPADSVVAVALHANRIVFVARGDLAEADTPARAATLARYLADILHRQDAEAVVVVGYGPPERVTPVVDAIRTALHQADLPIFDILRVTDGRYWSYLCTEPSCCPPDGKPYDPTTNQIAAAATYAGHVALPDRETLVQQLAPVTGPARVAMRRATRQARRRLATLLAGAPPIDPAGRQTIEAAGRPVVRTAMRRYRNDAVLTDDEVAWLSVLLTQLPVRDHAWERIGADPWQPTLWADVLRRAEPELAAAPASLLAFCAWRLGQGTLASVAVERALRAQPDYSMALLMDDVLRHAVPPDTLGEWPGPMSPEQPIAGPGPAVPADRPAPMSPDQLTDRPAPMVDTSMPPMEAPPPSRLPRRRVRRRRPTE